MCQYVYMSASNTYIISYQFFHSFYQNICLVIKGLCPILGYDIVPCTQFFTLTHFNMPQCLSKVKANPLSVFERVVPIQYTRSFQLSVP